MLASFKEVTYPNYEIIIIDNGSPTESPDSIKEKYPEVKLICSKENLGFAGGNNLGIKQAKGKYLLMLNNDTEVEPDFIDSLVDLMESDPQIGVVSPKIHYYYKENIIQYAGCPSMNLITSRAVYTGRNKKDVGQFDEVTETHAHHGACMMFRSSLLGEVGLLYEGYFLYYEEYDFAVRVKQNGYSIYYQPNSLIKHKESVSTGKSSPLKTYYLNRNRVLFIRRNTKGLTFLLAITYFYLIAFPKNTIKYLFRLKHLIALYKGLFWHLTHLKNQA